MERKLMDSQEAVVQKNKAIQMLHGECAEKDKLTRQAEGARDHHAEKLTVLNEQLKITQEALMNAEQVRSTEIQGSEGLLST